MPEWLTLNATTLWWLGGLSLVSFFGTLILVPVLVVNMPADYFVREHRRDNPVPTQHPVVRLLLIIGKNLLGVILLAGGLVMLFTPGQGLLTIAMGIVLMDFPGKFALERRVTRNRTVTRSMNWIRRRWNKPPLELPPASDGPDSVPRSPE
ncbi:MAG: PGPGW domain-containing protein [Pseudomonadota bacterium]